MRERSGGVVLLRTEAARVPAMSHRRHSLPLSNAAVVVQFLLAFPARSLQHSAVQLRFSARRESSSESAAVDVRYVLEHSLLWCDDVLAALTLANRLTLAVE